MSEEIFSVLLEKRVLELSDKAGKDSLSRMEHVEWCALEAHQDKTPAVAQRIRILAAKLAQPSRWKFLCRCLSKKFRQNLAELQALVQYGNSRAVWEIAYLCRKKASQKLAPMEKSELEHLITYYDCPDVLEISRLKMKEQFGELAETEARELSYLQRNLFRKDGIPDHLLDMFWCDSNELRLDMTGTR